MSVKNYEEWIELRDKKVEKYFEEKERGEGKGKQVLSDRYSYPILISPKKQGGKPLDFETYWFLFSLLDCTFEEGLRITSIDDQDKSVYFETGQFDDGTVLLRVDTYREFDSFFDSLLVVLNEMLKEYDVKIPAQRIQGVMEMKKSKDIIRK